MMAAMILLWPYRAGCKEEERSQGVDGVRVRGGKKAIHKGRETIHPEDRSAKHSAAEFDAIMYGC